MKSEILVEGRFKPEDIRVVIAPSNRTTTPQIECHLDTIWEQIERTAKEAGKRIYNGLSYRLNSLSEDGEKLNLELGIFDYRTREALLQLPGYYELNESYWRKGCHNLATIRTANDKYLLVELSGKSMNDNAVDFIGGIMETDPPIKDGEDVFDAFYREMEEEVFIPKSEVAEAYLRLIYRNPTTNIGFYFEVNLFTSSEVIQSRFESNAKELDIRSLKILTKDEYIHELRTHPKEGKRFLCAHLFG